MKWLTILLVLLAPIAVGQEQEIAAPDDASERDAYQFTQSDVTFLSQFSLLALPELPHDPSNRVGDSIPASNLGHALFFDTNLSGNGLVSCASCHQPAQYFTDGLKFSVAMGVTNRNAQTVLGAAYSPWLFWDGRKDSLWSQALGPLEDASEHGINRIEAVRHLASAYGEQYQAIFGESIEALAQLKDVSGELSESHVKSYWQSLSPLQRKEINQAFANMGKAMMAYQRRLTMQPARFDQFVEALKADASVDELAKHMNAQEIDGMRIFVGKGNCVSCHNGPLFTNFEFHNIGAPEDDVLAVDMGRFTGVNELQQDEFTCLSEFSDADLIECEEMRFLKKQGPELIGAFKTPSLRNIAKTAPYMQMGQFNTLAEVIGHYNKPVPPYYDRLQHPSRPHFDIMPLRLTEEEQSSLAAFLETLTSPILAEDKWWNVPQKNENPVISKVQ